MEITTQKVKLNTLKLNQDNPRRISTKDMDRLIKSLQDFPDMMGIREIVCDENYVVLGGNMRLLAMRKIGAKECTAKIVKGLTLEQKREFVVKDNGSWGEWDMDLLSGAWSDLPLIDWGVKIPEQWGETPETQEEKPDSVVPDKDPNILIRLSFHPGIWLGKREEIITITEKMKKSYNCEVKIEE